MKTKKLLSIISMCIFFLSITIFNIGIAKELGNDQEKATDPNWLKNHRRVKKPVREGFHVGLELSAEGESASLSIEADHKWIYVNCCKYTRRQYNWCNASLQNDRC